MRRPPHAQAHASTGGAPLLVAELWTLARPMSKARAVVRRVAWAALGFGVLFTALLRRPAANTVDPTDLVALVMLAVALGDARRLLHAQ